MRVIILTGPDLDVGQISEDFKEFSPTLLNTPNIAEDEESLYMKAVVEKWIASKEGKLLILSYSGRFASAQFLGDEISEMVISNIHSEQKDSIFEFLKKILTRRNSKHGTVTTTKSKSS